VMARAAKHKWIVATLTVLAFAIVGSAIAMASSQSGSARAQRGANAADSFSLRSGTPVSPALISDQYKRALESTGATDRLSLLGKSGDHLYYRASTADGHTCFAIGDSNHLLDLGCLHSDEEMPTALLDTASVAVTRDHPVVHLIGDEGIAADQVSTVGIEASDGSLITTPVADNVYRFADDAIPIDAVAIMAFDKSNAVIVRKTLK
jgi:hypothetical protein